MPGFFFNNYCNSQILALLSFDILFLMKNILTKVLLTVSVSSALLSACNKPDTDTPLPPKISPSVFIGSQNQFIYALDPTTGLKKWEAFIGADLPGSPVLYDDILFVPNASGVLYKLDPNTGAKGSSKILFPNGITNTPIGDNHIIYAPSGSAMIAVDIKPDTLEWRFNAGDVINTSPTIIDTQIVFGANDGNVYVVDKRSGNLIWKHLLGSGAQAIESSPVVDSTNVYIGAADGKMYCLRRSDGAQKWVFPTSAAIKSSAVVYGGNVLFGGDDNKLHCLENITGKERWSVTAGDRIRSSPYLSGHLVYVGSYDKSFFAVNILDGMIKWTFKSNGLIKSSPVQYNGKVYIGSYDKNFYALDTLNGNVSWKYTVNGLIDCSPAVDANNSTGSSINSSVSGASIYDNLQ